MPAYNFQPRFAAAVESGAKRQTVRAVGKRPLPKVGERFCGYTGMRTRACRLLVKGQITVVRMVRIVRIGTEVGVIVDGKPARAEEFALLDGFTSAAEMADWFERTHGLPFHGYLIQWR